MSRNEYLLGVRHGVPVGLGYLSVSFGFGALAATHGISAFEAAVISFTNLTSAGQFAGLTLILASAGLWEMVLTQMVINSRYALMSLALSQRMGRSIGLLPRFLLAFFNTDEIFALAMARKEPLTTAYFLGLATLPMLGWTAGTVLGALAGAALPKNLQAALGVMLYGMFVAIVVPPAKKERAILICALLALALSSLFAWLPILSGISAGISIVICTVAAAAVCAYLFPLKEEA